MTTRRAAIALLVPALVLALGVACGDDDGGAPVTAGGNESAGVPGCGGQIAALLGRDARLTVTAELPAQATAGGDGTFAGTVTVTATGQALKGVASTHADIYVAQSNRVVATPLPKDMMAAPVDLAAGESLSFQARGSLVGCEGPGTGVAEPLPAGRYEVYAAVVVVDDTGTGDTVTAVGGPWPLDVS